MRSEALLKTLKSLALDLRFSWAPAFTAVWEYVDAPLWKAVRSPWIVVGQLGNDRLESLCADVEFSALLDAAKAEQLQGLPKAHWFSRTYAKSPLKTIAYFSMEFGLSEGLPIYSGGLGVLAGDHLKAASDLGVPVTGIGLLYGEGYFRQILGADGSQQEVYPRNESAQLPVVPLRDASGDRVRIALTFPGRRVYVRVWEALVGRVRLFLLDSNDAANAPADRTITSRLYVGDKELRLSQELLLGVGGMRVLRQMGIVPQVRHLNEGHAAFAIFEDARRVMNETNCTYAEALCATRSGTVFTTHTPVEAAFDRFESSLSRRYLTIYAEEIGVDVEMLLQYGRFKPAETEPFTMPYLAIRGAGFINGVSKLHGEVSRELFQPLFPRHPANDVPVGSITNGIHVPTWSAPNAMALAENASDEELWKVRRANREDLIISARERLVRRMKLVQAGAEEIARAERALDPDIFTIGFARRFTGYKRATLLLSQPERLVKMLRDEKRPIQIVVAGKAHPDDTVGKAMVKSWVTFSRRDDVRGRVVFVDDYDLFVAEELVAGADIWLNTPRRPWEASGTSGMKVLKNGGLNVSELDGWWMEGYDPRCGWALGDGESHGDDAEWDTREAEQLYDLLEREIVPRFYDRDAAGLPREWLKMMRASIEELTPQFSAERMVREYTETLYAPAAEAYTERVAKNAALAREVHAKLGQLEAAWGSLSFGAITESKTGEVRRVSVEVKLGTLSAADVKIELYADGPTERIALTQDAAAPTHFEADLHTPRPLSEYTARAVPAYKHAILPIELPLMTWQR